LGFVLNVKMGTGAAPPPKVGVVSRQGALDRGSEGVESGAFGRFRKEDFRLRAALLPATDKGRKLVAPVPTEAGRRDEAAGRLLPFVEESKRVGKLLLLQEPKTDGGEVVELSVGFVVNMKGFDLLFERGS
jgi:hypothetical protein